MYLNEVYLGQRGSFAVHGVAEAARLFFGKDVSNLTLSEAATIAGVIQSPYSWSPFASPERCRSGATSCCARWPKKASSREESRASRSRADRRRAPGARRAGAVLRRLRRPDAQRAVSRADRGDRSLDVYTTLDLHLQRLAQDALRDGLTQRRSAAREAEARRQAQAALIAVDPRTGEVLALVGGRSYNQSQYNRAISAQRQPGSVFKPFVYLAAFERAAAEGRTDLTPATLVDD